MIRWTPKGYAVYSHRTGRRLSRFYKSRKAAERRLKQIRFFKYLKAGK